MRDVMDQIRMDWRKYSLKPLLGKELTAMLKDGTVVSVMHLLLEGGFNRGSNPLKSAQCDALLQRIEQQVAAATAQQGTLHPLNADEFVVLLPLIGKADALRLAQAIQQLVAQVATSTLDGLSASIGITMRLPDEKPDCWLMRTEIAMYYAKWSGQERAVAYWSNELLQQEKWNLLWDKQWESGNALIDEDHRVLLNLANQVLCLLGSAAPVERSVATLDWLLRQLEIHYEREERLLTQVRYPRLALYAQKHQELKNEGAALRAQVAAGRTELTDGALLLIGRMLQMHLLTEAIWFFSLIQEVPEIVRRNGGEDLKWVNVLLHNLPVAFVILDTEYNMVYANQTVAKITGYAANELRGNRCYELLGDGSICPGCQIVSCRETKKPAMRIKTEYDRNGNEKHVELTAVPLLDAQNEVYAFLEYVVDRTEEVNLQKKQQEDFLQVIEMMSLTLESKDHYTSHHSELVASYCEKIAAQLNMPQQEMQTLKAAALLHDIGKIGIPDAILLKPGALTAQEYREVQQHPTVGAAILSRLDSLRDIATVIRHHHERYDGLGYPDGLAGEETVLGARIIAVADALEAMTADRPYRKGRSMDEALAELVRCSGAQFDPAIVRAALSCFANAAAEGSAVS